MRNQPTTLLALSSLALFAGAAQAQYNGDPGLDPRVANVLPVPVPVPVPFQCEVPTPGGYADRAAPTLWPGGIVPFEIEGTVANPTLSINAMDVWMFRSGTSPNVTFVRRDPANPAHNNYIIIRGVAGSVSSSWVGLQGGGQIVEQGQQVNTYVMAHEYCHALGFDHEMCRPDRDSYVTVWFSRVSPASSQHNFVIRAAADWPAGSLNTGYDFDSVMHYSATSFMDPSCDLGLATCSSTLTCTPLVACFSCGYGLNQCTMGQQDHLSTNDVQDMINVYGARTVGKVFVGPLANSPSGTLAQPIPTPASVPAAAADVWIEGNRTYTVSPGQTFTSTGGPQIWRKHGTGPAVITGS